MHITPENTLLTHMAVVAKHNGRPQVHSRLAQHPGGHLPAQPAILAVHGGDAPARIVAAGQRREEHEEPRVCPVHGQQLRLGYGRHAQLGGREHGVGHGRGAACVCTQQFNGPQLHRVGV